MTLTREQRTRIFNGEAPRISGEGNCPFEAGETLKLSKKVSLRILTVVRKGTRWNLRYELLDRRDPVRNLRRTPGGSDFDEIRKSFDQHGYAPKLTEEEQRKAAQESAYTSAPSSLSDAGEAVDLATQKRLSLEAEQTFALRSGYREKERRDRWALEDRLRRAQSLATVAGVDLSTDLRVIERRVQAMEQKLGKRAA